MDIKMKKMVMNQNKMNQTDMMKQKQMIKMQSLMMKLGKGKRKIILDLSGASKMFLRRYMEASKKALIQQGSPPQNFINFLNYLEFELKKKKEPLKLTYDEVEYLILMIGEDLKASQAQELKWYNFIKKLLRSMNIKQFKLVIEELRK